LTIAVDKTTTKYEQLSATVVDNVKKHTTLWTAVGIGLSALVFVGVILCGYCGKKKKEKGASGAKTDAKSVE